MYAIVTVVHTYIDSLVAKKKIQNAYEKRMSAYEIIFQKLKSRYSMRCIKTFDILLMSFSNLFLLFEKIVRRNVIIKLLPGHMYSFRNLSKKWNAV